MVNRPTASLFVIIASLLASTAAILLYADSWSMSAVQPSSIRALALALLTLASQVMLGYVLWRLLQRQQKPVVRTEVLNSLVHEFQTPITAIRMAADILDSPIARTQPDRADKYIRIIREETERLQHQVETMLTLARADRNTLILNTEPINLHRLLYSVAERHGDYLTLRLSAESPHVLADRLHLTNVLHNLLDNAVKYSNGQPNVTLHSTLDVTGLTISVRDQGVGIPAQYIKQIFQPFFRVHDRNQPSVKGFGLGLSYVQRIVHAHNWSIDVTSQPGCGSEFSIYIPKVSLLPQAISRASLRS